MQWPIELYVIQALLLVLAGIPFIIVYSDILAENRDGKRAFVQSEVASVLLALTGFVSFIALLVLKFSSIDQILIKVFWS